jgi:hypothetical protein
MNFWFIIHSVLLISSVFKSYWIYKDTLIRTYIHTTHALSPIV